MTVVTEIDFFECLGFFGIIISPKFHTGVWRIHHQRDVISQNESVFKQNIEVRLGHSPSLFQHRLLHAFSLSYFFIVEAKHCHFMSYESTGAFRSSWTCILGFRPFMVTRFDSVPLSRLSVTSQEITWLASHHLRSVPLFCRSLSDQENSVIKRGSLYLSIM